MIKTFFKSFCYDQKYLKIYKIQYIKMNYPNLNHPNLEGLVDFANRLPMTKEQKINFILAILEDEKKKLDEVERNKKWFNNNVLSELLLKMKIGDRLEPVEMTIITPPSSPTYLKLNSNDFDDIKDDDLKPLSLTRSFSVY